MNATYCSLVNLVNWVHFMHWVIFRIIYQAIKMCRRLQKMFIINCLLLYLIKDHKCSMNDPNGGSISQTNCYIHKYEWSPAIKPPTCLSNLELKAWLSIFFFSLTTWKGRVIQGWSSQGCFANAEHCQDLFFCLKLCKSTVHNKGVLRIIFSNDVAH